MGAYSVAQAKAQLSALLQAVEQGEEVTITRRGVPIAVMLPVQKASSIDWERIRKCQQRSQPNEALKAQDWTSVVREMRDLV